MGQRNIANYSMEEWRATCENAGEMLAKGWKVIARCDHCGLDMAVNLRRVIFMRGPTLSLWNKDQPCRRLNCGGTMTFWATIPGLYQPKRLLAADHVTPRMTEGERAAIAKAEKAAREKPTP